MRTTELRSELISNVAFDMLPADRGVVVTVSFMCGLQQETEIENIRAWIESYFSRRDN